MTNVSVIASHREQNTAREFAARESSNDIDDVIETIDRLRLASRRESGKANKTPARKRYDEPSTKNIDDYDYKRDLVGGNREHYRGTRDHGDDQKGTVDYERDQNHDDKDSDSSDDALIERGPTRSQYFKSNRDRPYQDKLEQLDPFLIKITGQIMRDKECREKLEPCLRKLERANGYWDDNLNESHAHDSSRDTTAATIEDNFANESFILENVLNNNFQVAERVTENNFISLRKRIEDSDCLLRDDNVLSGSNSYNSSPAPSPASLIPVKSPKNLTLNISKNHGFSSEVASASSPYRSMQSLSSYPSDCSPSSSTQSYGEASSPISVQSNRTSIGSQLSEKFDDFQRRSRNDYELHPVPNTDNNELWQSMDEFLKTLDEENEKADRLKERDCSSAAIEGSNDASWNAFQSRDNVEAIKTFSDLSPETDARGKRIEATDFEGLLINKYLHDGQVENTVVNGYSIPSTIPVVTNTPAENVNNYRSKECKRVIDNSNRSTPWSSLYLPTTKASERLMERLNLKKVEKAMASLLKKSSEELVQQDKDGDTMLMCLVGNPDELHHKLAYLIPFVDRLSTIPGALAIANNRGEDALYLAALNCPQLPFVAGYLAATMIEKGIDVSQRLYRRRGDTLIHSIAAQGDSHKETLAELLGLNTVQGNGVFDLSKRNYDGKTALHVAIESHDPLTKGITSVENVRQLLKYGADPSISETKCGDNALHMAVTLSCDPVIVQLLLDTSAVSLVNATNYYLNTPLHAAAANSSANLDKQMEVCSLLIRAGSQTNIQNRQGRTPLALASSERKEAIKRVFYRRS